MQIFTDTSNPIRFKHPVVTIGTFDGVHLGHRSILEEIKRKANDISGEAVVVTFDPHPRIALGQEVFLLNTRDEKRRIFEKSGISGLIEIPFTSRFSELSADAFIEFLYTLVKPEHIVIGYDHGFGHNRLGNIGQFRKMGSRFGFVVEQIDEQHAANSKISSTIIRKLLHEGAVQKAAELLGYAYQVSGQVVRGNQIGKLIGYPTANLHVADPYKLIPAMGVYASRVILRGNVYNSMTNIGLRPTLNAQKLTIETNIFGFSDDIYYETMTVILIKRIRDERKFADLENLKRQLGADRETVLNLLDKIPGNGR